jgi:hypothetical protein
MAKIREINDYTYTEKHHIIPKSIGGNNTKENLVHLTAKEHFICHLLLTKMLDGTDKQKMIYAIWQLSNQNNIHQNRIKINASTYSYLREIFSKNHSNWMKKNQHLIEEKRRKYWTDEKRKEHAEKISIITKGRKVSEATKEKLRNKTWSEKALKNLKEIGLKSASLRKGKSWSENMRSKRFNNYLEKNFKLAKEVIILSNQGFNNLKISKNLNISWDRVKYILKYRIEFDSYIKEQTKYHHEQ